MGWSLALHICTDALEHAVRIAGPGCDLARERCEAPLMTVAEPVRSVYVDNINVHGITSESCDRRHEVIFAALGARGFSLHEVSRASQHHKQPRAFEKSGGFGYENLSNLANSPRRRSCPPRSLESSWWLFSRRTQRNNIGLTLPKASDDRRIVRFLARPSRRAHQQNFCASPQP